MLPIRLVAGLGNPGRRYAATRHNAGFWFADALAAKLGVSMAHESRFGSEVGKKDDLRLAKPSTYMNDSGRAVAALARFFAVSPDELLIVHDELDLPFGRLRIRTGGSSAGNHGLDSLIGSFGTKTFPRIRVGVGRPVGDAVDYVLSPFTDDERARLPDLIRRVADAVEYTVEHGLDRAMTEFNR